MLIARGVILVLRIFLVLWRTVVTGTPLSLRLATTRGMSTARISSLSRPGIDGD